MKTATLESKFPLLSVEHGCIVSKDADITVAYKVELPELFTLTKAEYESVHSTWAKAVKVLPNYSIVHKHRIEIGIFVERQAAVDLLLVHTRREGRLLAVTQRKVSDFEISRHFIISFKGSLARIHCYSNNKGNKPSRICNFFPGNFQEKRPGRFLSVKKTGNRTIIRPICRRAGTVPGREARRGICV